MSCQCDYSAPPSYSVVQCHFCNPQTSDPAALQRKIWQQVRVSASSFMLTKSALAAAANLLQANTNTNWNQRSDRLVPHIQTAVHPTHGNSLRSTLTSLKPGACAPGGVGVDKKHDSYARFLNRKKGQVLKTQTTNIAAVPRQGNKTRSYGLVQNSDTCCA